jgi:hypothetical protein
MIMSMSSTPEELTDIIQRREGAKIAPAGQAGSYRK